MEQKAQLALANRELVCLRTKLSRSVDRRRLEESQDKFSKFVKKYDLEPVEELMVMVSETDQDLTAGQRIDILKTLLKYRMPQLKAIDPAGAGELGTISGMKKNMASVNIVINKFGGSKDAIDAVEMADVVEEMEEME